MKKMRFFAILACSLTLFSAAPVFGAETIERFENTIDIAADGSMRVVEHIYYNFGAEQKHGIFREIPYRYETPRGRTSIDVDDIAVTDAGGKVYETEVTRNAGIVRIKIGDPDVLVTGRNTYIISYTVRRGLNYFPDHDELYWNVTGDAWNVPMEAASAIVTLPSGSISRSFSTCYYGPYGNQSPCTTIDVQPVEGRTVVFLQDFVEPGAGFTIVAGFPKGLVKEPTSRERAMAVVKDNWIVGMPAVVFFAMLALWFAIGRDHKGRGTIIPEYEPPEGLIPSQAGAILDDSVDARDISADIVELAVLGYLKITRMEKKGVFGSDDYLLEQLKPADTLENPILKKLLSNLFSLSRQNLTGPSEDNSGMAGITKLVTRMAFGSIPDDAPKHPDAVERVMISQLKNTFHADAKALTAQIYRSLVTAGYMKRNPAMIRGIFVVLPILAGIFAGQYVFAAFGAIGVASIVVSGLIMMVFGHFLPARTQAGAHLREKVLGFKMYLSVAEKDRIAFHNAPEKNPETFERFLPYAMAFKVEKKWAAQFDGMQMRPPSWYGDSSARAFSAGAFVGGLSGFQSAATKMASASSGGSGMSGGAGGGRGGGGGGSW